MIEISEHIATHWRIALGLDASTRLETSARLVFRVIGWGLTLTPYRCLPYTKLATRKSVDQRHGPKPEGRVQAMNMPAAVVDLA